jgi:thioredoxin-like negative regulator of GroEL
MLSSKNLFLLAAFIMTIALLIGVTIDAVTPPHGVKPLKANDPRLKHDHTLKEAIPHVFDVKAEYLRHYMRPVKGYENRMTLLILYSSWCGEACDKWVPVLKEIALYTREAQIAHRLTIIKHDVTKDEVIAHKLKVEGLPAIGLVEAAHHTEWEFKRYNGPADADSVIAFMEQNSPDHFKEAHGKLREKYTQSKSV